MTKEITPTGAVKARVGVPGSKSMTNRILVCAALAQGVSAVRNASDSEDTARMINGLNQLGVLVRKEGPVLLVEGRGGKLYAPKFPIHAGNAGTVLRFLMSVAALAEGSTVVQGDRRMEGRPNEALVDALRQLGTEVEYQGARFLVRGGSLIGGRVRLRSPESSQFVSSLLMVSPYARHDVEIEIEGSIPSASYIEMTAGVMRAAGVEVGHDRKAYFLVHSGQRYRPGEFCVEPDAAAASYFFAAAAITGGEVLVEGMTSAVGQGEIGFLEVLRAMGCVVRQDAEGVLVRGPSQLRGVDVDMNDLPDVVPTLAVVALFADTQTTIRNAAHLRYKESNRLEVIAGQLAQLGARIEARPDGLAIYPGPLHGAQLDPHDDHRLVMSFALAGLRVPGVRIETPQCVAKSFPAFWEQFDALSLPAE